MADLAAFTANLRGRTANIDEARRFLDSERGSQMIGWMAERSGDAGMRELWQRTNGKLPTSVLVQLTDETDPVTDARSCTR